jgi:Flp pilus assembly protein TadD
MDFFTQFAFAGSIPSREAIMIRFFSTLTLLAFFAMGLQATTVKVHFVNPDKTPVAGVSVTVVNTNPLLPKLPTIQSVTYGSTEVRSSSSSGSGTPAPIGQTNGVLVGYSGGPDDFSPDVGKVFRSNKNGEISFGLLILGSYKIVSQKKGYGTIGDKAFEMTTKDQELTVTIYSAAILDQVRKLQAEGNSALTQQQYNVALDRYQEMLKIMPDEPVIYSNLSQAYAYQEDWEKAIPAAQKAAELDNVQFGKFSKMIQALELDAKAKQLINQRDYPKAIETLNQAVALDNTNAELFYGLALAYGRQKNYTEGQKYIEQALKIKPYDSVYLSLQETFKSHTTLGSK